MRDMYYLQEENVLIDSNDKYRCEICGKAFIGQLYLDMHFDNRHSDYVSKVSKTEKS